MKSNQPNFIARANQGMADPSLQKNLTLFRNFAPAARNKTIARMGDYEQLRHWVKEQKDHTLDNLGHYLQEFERNLNAVGGEVLWATTPDQANALIVDICQQHNAKKIVKGKSMISEETQLNSALLAAGFDTVETDLGEYIIQLADEPPSHIIGPAIHKTFEQVVELFRDHHDFGDRPLDTTRAVMQEARQVLRDKFLRADVGITGANYLIADSGTVGLVTNEGNGDLCSTLPKVHIVITSIEKILPTMDVAMGVQRLLVPNATAQAITCYTSFFTGPKRSADTSGPEHFYVVLLDNKRSDILQGHYRDILRCIRCSACLNHCPVYTRTGGHAYDSVYPGPMGSVWSPLLNGLAEKHELPNACTTCGRCSEVCPMEIPLVDMLRDLRHDEQQAGLQPARWVWGMRAYMWLLRKPRLFHWTTGIAIALMHRLGKRQGYFRKLLLANGWTDVRDFPAPEGKTFFAQLNAKQASRDKRSDAAL